MAGGVIRAEMEGFLLVPKDRGEDGVEPFCLENYQGYGSSEGNVKKTYNLVGILLGAELDADFRICEAPLGLDGLGLLVARCRGDFDESCSWLRHCCAVSG